MAQLRQAEKEFTALGARIACVVGLDAARTQYFAKQKPGPYVALSDPSTRVAALYGIAKQLLVHDEWVNAPSVFIIKDGVVKWKYVGKSWGDRPSVETILAEAKKAKE